MAGLLKEKKEVKEEPKTVLVVPGTCRSCRNIWTSFCPIRVWGRRELNEGKHLDVDPNKDFCSRFKEIGSD